MTISFRQIMLAVAGIIIGMLFALLGWGFMVMWMQDYPPGGPSWNGRLLFTGTLACWPLLFVLAEIFSKFSKLWEKNPSFHLPIKHRNSSAQLPRAVVHHE